MYTPPVRFFLKRTPRSMFACAIAQSDDSISIFRSLRVLYPLRRVFTAFSYSHRVPHLPTHVGTGLRIGQHVSPTIRQEKSPIDHRAFPSQTLHPSIPPAPPVNLKMSPISSPNVYMFFGGLGTTATGRINIIVHVA